TMVVVLGSLLVFTSRNERQAASNPLKSEKPRPPAPSKNFPGDHWHAAYGIYICDEFVPAIQSDRDPSGIHTHNDGVIHIHPFTRAVSGRNATFGVFADTVGLEVSSDSIQVPGGTRYENGDTCEGQDDEGELRVFLNGDERTGDPKKIRLRDRDLLVVAFAPAGADVPEEPPSASQLDNLSDVSPVSNPEASVPEGSVPEGGTDTSAPPAPEGGTDTSAPPGTDPTTATTAAPTPSPSP
ncbi:MAG TPA: hypothetical protein VM263_12675, partial [Acidimicrobiales bacterium]|nr:hypothetical protein [Acidimicrobiales bacterium]